MLLHPGHYLGQLGSGEPVFIAAGSGVREELRTSIKNSLATITNDFRDTMCLEFGHGARRFAALLRFDGIEPCLNLERLQPIGAR